ncbi:MAG: ketoacyl-ACP synthase III [Spirochaetes bacterium]|nr:ketoacyl-ACP synthase III [Spirochaetota bacterium]
MSFSILGTGCALPELAVKNEDLSKIMDTSDEWIVKKSGIKERRIVSHESLTDLSETAALNALADANVKAQEIDLLIYATLMGDTVTPSMACVVAGRIGAVCPAFDLNAACSGFVYAMDIAAGYFARKKVKKVLIIGGEHLSRHTDWADRGTCVLFGDGAAAAVLGEGDALCSLHIASTPNKEFLSQNFIGGESPFCKRDYGQPYIRMNGQEVYKFAVNAICNDLKYVMEEARLSEKDIDHFLLHQANIRIIDAAIKMLDFPKEKFLNSIEQTGNVSAASIPILLDKGNRSGRFKKGDTLAISAFGAGLTTGSAIIRWTK